MRKCTHLLAMLCVVHIIFSGKALAQTPRPDSSSQQNALNNAITLFHASIAEQSPLYNGPEYNFYDPKIKGTAYFAEVNTFTSGSVYYDGLLFTGVPMLYDLYSDNVAVLLYNHFSKFYLLKEKLKSFDFLGHHFVNINADTLGNGTVLKSGIYDELYNGKLQVLVKRSKSIQNTSGLVGVESYFSPAVDYYLRKNNVYYSIGGKSSMLNILKDRKKELQQYIKAAQINFRKEPEDAMVKIATFYDHLNN
jgi:hypothetical protein